MLRNNFASGTIIQTILWFTSVFYVSVYEKVSTCITVVSFDGSSIKTTQQILQKNTQVGCLKTCLLKKGYFICSCL